MLFACVEVDDGDDGLVGDRDDAFVGVLGADAEVVHAAGAADAHLSVGVDVVVSDAVVVGGAGACGECFRGGAVCGAGGGAVSGAVRAVLVVVVAELVELLVAYCSYLRPPIPTCIRIVNEAISVICRRLSVPRRYCLRHALLDSLHDALSRGGNA